MVDIFRKTNDLLFISWPGLNKKPPDVDQMVDRVKEYNYVLLHSLMLTLTSSHNSNSTDKHPLPIRAGIATQGNLTVVTKAGIKKFSHSLLKLSRILISCYERALIICECIK